MRLDNLLKTMDIEFFGTGKHGVSPEKATRFINDGETFFVDVRTKEENKLVSFPFMHHIPLNEFPKRYREIPKDKLVILFCSSVVRSAIAYAYLLEKGYEQKNLKILLGPSEKVSGILKPPTIYSSLDI